MTWRRTSFGTGEPMKTELIALDPNDIAPGRALRQQFSSYWAQAQGTPAAIFDGFIARTPVADGTKFRAVTDAAGPGLWCDPVEPVLGQVILYIHGGAYKFGSPAAYHGFVSQLAVRTRRSIFSLDYPLSSERSLPVALEMATRVLARLSSEHGSVAICGDSAGGGMALATLASAQRLRIPVGAAAVFSPWTDLGLTGDSARGLAITDPLLDVEYLRACAQQYLGANAPDEPRASPLHAIPPGLPPVLLQVGLDEVLLDDSRRYARAAAAAGNDVVLEEWEGMHHVFQLNVAELATARHALDRAAAFLTSRLH